MSKDDFKQVKITHPDGINMRFSENISEFLMNRTDKAKPFFVGDWLKTLGNDLIAQLGALNEQYLLDNDEINLDDLVQTVMFANIAETKVNSASPEELMEWMPVFAYICSIESLRREGLIEISEPLSLRPKKRISVRVTDLGLQKGIDLNSRFH